MCRDRGARVPLRRHAGGPGGPDRRQRARSPPGAWSPRRRRPNRIAAEGADWEWYLVLSSGALPAGVADSAWLFDRTPAAVALAPLERRALLVRKRRFTANGTRITLGDRLLVPWQKVLESIDGMKRLASRSTWWHTLPHKSEPAVNAAKRRGQPWTILASTCTSGTAVASAPGAPGAASVRVQHVMYRPTLGQGRGHHPRSAFELRLCSGSGRLCHGDGTQARGARRRRAFMSPILDPRCPFD